MKPTVLVAEGNEVLRGQLAERLRFEGLEVVTASNGNDALAVVRNRGVSVMVTELTLAGERGDGEKGGEGLDGMDLLRVIRGDARLRDLPVVILTNVAERERVVEAAKLRPRGYILKSKLDLASLTSLVRSAAGGTGVSAGPAGDDGGVAGWGGGGIGRRAGSGSSSAAGPAVTVAGRGAAASGSSDGAGGAGASGRVGEVPPTPGIPGTEWIAPGAGSGPTDPAEVLRLLRPMMTRSEVLERVDGCDRLRSFSPVVSRLIKLTSSSECSMDQVVKTISSDQAIALKVLKMANSAAFARGDSVDSVKTAVMRIGLASIREVVMGISVVEQFGAAESKAADLINLPMFWEHGIGCAVTAAYLAKAIGGLSADSAFTAGLLHDVGRIVYLEQIGRAYQEVIATARAARLPLEVVEQRMLLLNHADVTDRLLHRWKFSKEMINPIVFHHLSAGGIRQTAPRQMEAVGVLALANRLTHAMLIGSSGNDVVYPTEELCQMLRVRGGGGGLIEEVVERAPDEAASMKFVMLTAGASAGSWRTQAETLADLVKVPFRPLFVGPEPAVDAYAIFCRRLASAAGSEAVIGGTGGGGGGPVGEGGDEAGAERLPTIGVMHIPHTRERGRVSQMYREAEERAGVARLPLVVISPLGRLEPEPSVMADRVVRAVAGPVVPTQFIAVVNEITRAGRSAATRKAA